MHHKQLKFDDIETTAGHYRWTNRSANFHENTYDDEEKNPQQHNPATIQTTIRWEIEFLTQEIIITRFHPFLHGLNGK